METFILMEHWSRLIDKRVSSLNRDMNIAARQAMLPYQAAISELLDLKRELTSLSAAPEATEEPPTPTPANPTPGLLSAHQTT